MGGARGALGLSPRFREPPSRRLRRLRIAHERMARRPRKRGETRAENRLEERADDTVVRVKGEKADVGVVTDAAPGRVLGLDAFVERDFGRIHGVAWRLHARLRGRGDGPDILSAYKPVVGRQICIARVKNRARKRLDKIEGWDWGKARIWRRLTELPYQRRLGTSAVGARGSGRRRDSSPYAHGSEREVEGIVTPPAGRSSNEQLGGARDKRK